MALSKIEADISMMRKSSYRHKWLVKLNFLVTVVSLLFLVISCITFLFLQYQFGELKNQTLVSDRVMTGFLSDFIIEHEKAAMGILQSYASRLSFINAVKNKDVVEAHRNLQDLKKNNAEIDLTFITDQNGILWGNYPVFPEALGKDLSSRDWYKGVSSQWKPYVSDVFKLIVETQPLAVAVAVPVFDLQGQVAGVLATSQRLTFLNDLFNRLPSDNYSTITVVDRMGNIIHSNKPYPTGTVMGYSLFPAVKNALEEKKNQIAIQKPIQKDETVYLTVQSVTLLGWTIVVEHGSKGIIQAGLPRFITTAITFLLIYVITCFFLLYARKHMLYIESEARFRNATEGSLDAFFILRSVRDIKRRIIDFEFVDLNKAAENMLEMSREKVIGEKLCELIPINRTGGFFEKYVRVVETGELLEEEFPIEAEQIHASWLRHQVVPLGDGVAVVSRDITSRKRAEEEIIRLNQDLKQQAAQLEASNKELETFSYSVSHDLRAPLRGIDGWSLALLEDYGGRLDDEGLKHLNRVRSETQHMGQLIDNLLKLSRVTQTEMRLMPVDLTALAHNIAARLQEELPHRGIEFIIEPGLNADGDKILLDLALTNLLDNAVKFTGPRSDARIEFGLVKADGCPVFFVRDNGVGFDTAYASKLFGAFQRLHKKSEFPGTGIGLATVQRIIHRHGGRIWAETQTDQGATFYFTLKEAV
jgi:PAS domain S-box-containing protein